LIYSDKLNSEDRALKEHGYSDLSEETLK